MYTTAGQYSAFCTATKIGTYSLSIYIASQPIMGSPYTITVTPGIPNYPSTTATGNGLTSTIAGVSTSFSIQSRDQFGNLIPSNTSSYIITATHTSGTTTPITSIIYNNNTNVYDVSYILTLAGVYQLSVTNPAGVNIKGSPFTLTIVPGKILFLL